jgi:mannose-6-phosphate isomerase
VRPVELPPNQFRRFYAGGARIGALRGIPTGDDHHPEDWVGSTTTTWGQETDGLSRLADGRVLRDVLRAEPEALLGPEHVQRWGPDPALLVKLLDAGERLPVHFHPGRAFAREHLGVRYGKTEAWIILEAEPGAAVHLGLRDEVGDEIVRSWVDAQDADAMLAVMNRVEVDAGDTVLVPAGTVHAIGAGILLLELQEPTDLSVLVEWKPFGVDDGPEHLGLGWDVALRAMDSRPTDPGELVMRGELRLPAVADPYFRAQRVRAGDELEPSFAILLCVSGEGRLRTEHGDELRLARGTTALVPHAAGVTTVAGDAVVIRCLPPDPTSGEGMW